MSTIDTTASCVLRKVQPPLAVPLLQSYQFSTTISAFDVAEIVTPPNERPLVLVETSPPSKIWSWPAWRGCCGSDTSYE